MSERKSWIKNESTYKLVVGDVENMEQLAPGIYNVGFDPQSGWFLTHAGDEFTFGYKLYGLEGGFIDRVIRTYQNTNGNLGILLNGVKGTGKTVTAKVIANRLKLPIIMAKSFGKDNTDVMEYISSFNFDCVLFFDEFEKTFNSKDSSVLKIMDGSFHSEYRRVFLLTTNTTDVNENMLSRPSRIRYVKEFGNLEENIVREYLDDNLNDKSRMEDIVSFVDTLQLSTIDILKTIVEDVNIYGFDDFMDNKDIFNVKTAEYHYDTLYARFGASQFESYDEKNFLRDAKKILTLQEPSKYGKTDEQYQKEWEEYQAQLPALNYNKYMTIDSNKPVKNIKPGDMFGRYEDEVVMEADTANGVIKTVDIDDNAITLYYVKNPNTKPSLFSHGFNYSAAVSKVYGYGCEEGPEDLDGE